MTRLYLRIWLAVVLAVALLTLLVGWVWRLNAEPPLREVVLRDGSGQVIGHGRIPMRRAATLGDTPSEPPSRPWRPRPSGPSAPDAPERPPPGEGFDAPGRVPGRPGRLREGPEFEVRMRDGQTVHLHLPRSSANQWRPPFGFFWTLGLVAVAVALATYPIVRRLTKRLEDLQRGVQRWGDGDLSARLIVSGKDEVGFLASQFNAAAARIESLVQSRDALLASQKSLLANASHELRSPLARIRMGLELLPEAPDRTAAATHAEIARNIAELDLLVDEILLASRLDAHEADLGTVESVDLVGLVAEECARADTPLEIDPTATATSVQGVSKLLRRAVRNLLENARRHAHGPGTLSLQHDGSWACLRVCDQGPGVPEAYRQRIFEPFFRLPGASERDGGVGLGLALVRAIALRHGGSVQCTPREGPGACFELRLPLTPESRAHDPMNRV